MPFKGAGFDAVEGVTTRTPAGDVAPGGSALAILIDTFRSWGLPDSLAHWAWTEQVAGKSDEEIALDLQERPEFKAEYGNVIEGRKTKGLAPMSVEEILSYRQNARELFHAAGLPKEFYDTKDEIDRFMVGNVSLAELNTRVQRHQQAAYNTPREVLDLLARDYGINDAGALTAWYMDPDVAEPLLDRQYQAATIGGAAIRTGFGATTREQNENLAMLGVTADQATSGFGQLAGQSELFNPLPGESTGETITQDEQIAAVFGGNARERRRIARQQRSRQAVFEGGGGFATTAGGVTGLSDV